MIVPATDDALSAQRLQRTIGHMMTVPARASCAHGKEAMMDTFLSIEAMTN